LFLYTLKSVFVCFCHWALGIFVFLVLFYPVGLEAPGGDIKLSKRPYHIGSQSIIYRSQALETFKLYSATQCNSDTCLIIHLAWLGVWLCKMESTSNQKLVSNSNIASSRLIDLFALFSAPVCLVRFDTCCSGALLEAACLHFAHISTI